MARNLSKKILRQIARDFSKSLLENVEALIAFEDSGLTDSECEIVQQFIFEISDKISKNTALPNTRDLVCRYVDFE